MLIDPENCEEWEQNIRARTLDEAQQICEEIAHNHPLTEVINVTQVTKTPYKDTYKFTCWFRSEAIDP